MRTNPAYLHLARRKTILRHMVNYMMGDLVGANGDEPKETLICEEVFQVDAVVPTDDILGFVEEMQEKEAVVQLEMNKFQFTRDTDEQHDATEPEEPQSPGGSKQKGGKGGGKS